MHSYVRPNQFIAFKLPSEATRIQKVVPNTYALDLPAPQ